VHSLLERERRPIPQFHRLESKNFRCRFLSIAEFKYQRKEITNAPFEFNEEQMKFWQTEQLDSTLLR